MTVRLLSISDQRNRTAVVPERTCCVSALSSMRFWKVNYAMWLYVMWLVNSDCSLTLRTEMCWLVDIHFWTLIFCSSLARHI